MTVTNVSYVGAPDAEGQSHIVTATVGDEMLSHIDLRVPGWYANMVNQWIAAGNVPAAYVAPAPVPQTYTFLQFMALYTEAEQDAIFASNDTKTKMFVTMAAGSGGLQLTNAEVIAGIDYLASAAPGPALITADRAAQILAGSAPAAS